MKLLLKVKLKCVKATNECIGCIFFNESYYNDCSYIALGDCIADYRKDKTDVIFIKVEK